ARSPHHSQLSSSKRAPVVFRSIGASCNPKSPASHACAHTTGPASGGATWAHTHERCARSYGSCIPSLRRLGFGLLTCSWGNRLAAYWLASTLSHIRRRSVAWYLWRAVMKEALPS